MTNSLQKIEVLVESTEHVAMIVPAPTGVIYVNHIGGSKQLDNQVEGFMFPFDYPDYRFEYLEKYFSGLDKPTHEFYHDEERAIEANRLSTEKWGDGKGYFHFDIVMLKFSTLNWIYVMIPQPNIFVLDVSPLPERAILINVSMRDKLY